MEGSLPKGSDAGQMRKTCPLSDRSEHEVHESQLCVYLYWLILGFYCLLNCCFQSRDSRYVCKCIRLHLGLEGKGLTKYFG